MGGTPLFWIGELRQGKSKRRSPAAMTTIKQQNQVGYDNQVGDLPCGIGTKKTALQIPSARLLPLDGLKQRLEVTLSEASAALALDDLVEHRGTILHRPGKDL